MSDDLDLDELERMEKAATPGPWEYVPTVPHSLSLDEQLAVTLRNAAPALIAEIKQLRAQLAEAQSALREIYEVWAGMDGIECKTAPEAYLLRLLEQCAKIAREALGADK